MSQTGQGEGNRLKGQCMQRCQSIPERWPGRQRITVTLEMEEFKTFGIRVSGVRDSFSSNSHSPQ